MPLSSIRSQFSIIVALIIASEWLPAQNTEPPQLDFTEGVVVITDGRVFSGRITNIAGGYRIDSNGTYGIVPFSKVDVTAPTLNEAYIALRDRVLKPRAEDHLKLAEWCLTNELIGQARTEALKALKLEPLRPESKALLVKIEKKLNPVKEKPKLPTGPAMTVDGFRSSDEKTSAGLSRESHQEYIRHVQPLILNKCGNAYCHGQVAKNSFRLTAIRSGSLGNKLQSQSNLKNVMQFIDIQRPDESQFLTKPLSTEKHHRKTFLGPHGNNQHEILKRWVANVAKDLGGVPQSIQSTPKIAAPPAQIIQQVNAERIAEKNYMPPPQQKNIRLQDIINQSQPDLFDPDIFNRQVHGASAKELRKGKGSKSLEVKSEQKEPEVTQPATRK